MRINKYSDHIAYQFEDTESIFAVTERVLRKQKQECIMRGIPVSTNGNARIMYNVSDYKELMKALSKMNEKDLFHVLQELLDLISMFEHNDFLQKETIDISIYNLYYDSENKTLKCAVLPVNRDLDYHDNQNWQSKFRQTIATILKVCLKGSPRGYQDLYNELFDGKKSDMEIVDYLKTCNYQWYGLGNSVTSNAQQAITQKDKDITFVKAEVKEEEKPLMILTCISHAGQNPIQVTCSDFTLGSKNGTAMGKVVVGATSRNHCQIIQTSTVMAVKDLKSTNGTYINGFRLNPDTAYTIKDGDTLKLADVEFKVKI